MFTALFKLQTHFMETLNGKNILVLGATGGIGSKTVKLLAGSGAKLFIAGRNMKKLQQVANDNGVPAERTFVLFWTYRNPMQ